MAYTPPVDTTAAPGMVSLGAADTSVAPGSIRISGQSPTLPADFADSGFFTGGTLRTSYGEGEAQDFVIVASDEPTADGIVTITLDDDLDPWPAPGDRAEFVASDGLRFSAETAGAGTPGSPYTYDWKDFQWVPEGVSLTSVETTITPGEVSLGSTASSVAPGSASLESAETTTPPEQVSLGAPDTTSGPDAVTLTGETSPVAPAPPSAPLAIWEADDLPNDINVRRVVGNRSAPVTVNLPATPGAFQVIEIADGSGQALDYAITVSAQGDKNIGLDGATSFVLPRPAAVLNLFFNPASDCWHIR